jgi:TonB family protein
MYHVLMLLLLVLLGCSNTKTSYQDTPDGINKFIQKTEDLPNSTTRHSLISHKPPEYTQALRDSGAEGYNIIQFDIDETGAVHDIQIMESEPKGVFDKYTISSVQTWQYSPARKDDHPIRVENLVHFISYCLDDEEIPKIEKHKICYDHDYQIRVKSRWLGK